MTGPTVVIFALGLAIGFFGILTESQGQQVLGLVKCQLFLQHSEDYFNAYQTCWEKKRKETLAEEEKERKMYPWNATIEDFEWDDKCLEHCAYNQAGILKDDSLPEETNTEKLIAKGKVSDERYNLITSVWDECLQISAKVSKEKGFNKCLSVTHHNFCFRKKYREIVEKLEITC